MDGDMEDYPSLPKGYRLVEWDEVIEREDMFSEPRDHCWFGVKQSHGRSPLEWSIARPEWNFKWITKRPPHQKQEPEWLNPWD